MEYGVLKSILLDELGGKKKQDAIVVEERVSLLVDVGGRDPLSIERVGEVRFADKYIEVSSDESRYYLEPDSILAVRTQSSAPRDSRPGFH